MRVNPHELHVKDPEWFEKLYVGYGGVGTRSCPLVQDGSFSSSCRTKSATSILRRPLWSVLPWEVSFIHDSYLDTRLTTFYFESIWDRLSRLASQTPRCSQPFLLNTYNTRAGVHLPGQHPPTLQFAREPHDQGRIGRDTYRLPCLCVRVGLQLGVWKFFGVAR